MSTKTLDHVQAVSDALRVLDSDPGNCGVTYKEFCLASNNHRDALDLLVDARAFSDWSEFKNLFIESQANLGFEWHRVQGAHGPLQLKGINLPASVGRELALKLHRASCLEGDMAEQVRAHVPALTSWLGAEYASIVNLDAVRAEFSATEYQNKTFKFSPGRGYAFTSQTSVYKFPRLNPPKGAEFELGEGVRGLLEKEFDLSFLKHSQSERGGASLQNADFQGFQVVQGIDADRVLTFSFELKASNSIKSVTQAITQCASYRSFSNFTYIVIPLLSKHAFHDTERLATLLDTCRSSGIGAISINLEPPKHEILGVETIVKAADQKPTSLGPFKSLITTSKHEYCPLCRRVVNLEQDRAGCGWMVTRGQTDVCMKVAMENQSAGNRNASTASKSVAGNAVETDKKLVTSE